MDAVTFQGGISLDAEPRGLQRVFVISQVLWRICTPRSDWILSIVFCAPGKVEKKIFFNSKYMYIYSRLLGAFSLEALVI